MPAKGTPVYDVCVSAIDVALSAPLRRGQHVTHALVSWDAITTLRDRLDALGIDWRKHHRDHDRGRPLTLTARIKEVTDAD